ncbi:MAG: hypothetical protein PHY27_14735 [Parabacteroides sp.]|nr:hypothetical protein [Parabacteroides sp.]
MRPFLRFPLFRRKHLKFDLYFSALIQLLIVLRQLIPFMGTQYLSLFQQSYLLPYSSLGFRFGPASLDVPVTHHGFS